MLNKNYNARNNNFNHSYKKSPTFHEWLGADTTRKDVLQSGYDSAHLDELSDIKTTEEAVEQLIKEQFYIKSSKVIG